jgi:hypothetical protein
MNADFAIASQVQRPRSGFQVDSRFSGSIRGYTQVLASYFQRFSGIGNCEGRDLL